MATQSEAALEQGLIRTLQNMSYEFVQIDEETNLHNNFKRQLELHNQRTLNQVGRSELTDKEFERVMIHLAGGTRFEKAKKLRNLFALDLDDGQRVWLEFLNTQKWCQNEFQVSNQITVEGRRKCRYDVTILINGLPLVQIELKRRGVECKKPRAATPDEKKFIGQDVDKNITIYEPCGCPKCDNTGYKGRIGVYEIMRMTPALKQIISKRQGADILKEKAMQEGMRTLRMSGSEYVMDGTTSFAELVKISFDV